MIFCKRWNKMKSLSTHEYIMHKFNFSILSIPWFYWARKDFADWQHGIVRVQTLCSKNPEWEADHVPMWQGILNDRARTIRSNMYSRRVVASTTSKVWWEIFNIVIKDLYRGLSISSFLLVFGFYQPSHWQQAYSPLHTL